MNRNMTAQEEGVALRIVRNTIFEQRFKRSTFLLKENEVYATLLIDKILSETIKIMVICIIYYLSEDV